MKSTLNQMNTRTFIANEVLNLNITQLLKNFYHQHNNSICRQNKAECKFHKIKTCF